MKKKQDDNGKQYSREYYERWYHDPKTRITDDEETERKVHFAVSAAEYVLGDPIRSVLDVGCGEASWRAPLKRIRPDARYVGVESSDYVLERFGRERNIRRGTFGGLSDLGLKRPFDLVVCADVVQYIDDDEFRRGLDTIRRLTGGVLYIETFVNEDGMEGDHDNWHDRSERQMRKFFAKAGLTHLGLYCWVDEKKMDTINRLEKSAR